MRIEKAESLAKLVGLLHRLKLVNWQKSEKLIDALTMRVLRDSDII